MTGSNHRVGGGCRPTGLNKPQPKRDLPLFISDPEAYKKKLAANQDELDRKHQEWLKTDEGIAWIAKETKRKDDEREAKAREAAFMEKLEALRQPPAVGEVITPRSGRYTIRVAENPKRPTQISAYVLLRVEGKYPNDTLPYRDLGNSGRHGLKVFLSPRSVDFLGETCHETFDRIIHANEKRRQAKKERDAKPLPEPEDILLSSWSDVRYDSYMGRPKEQEEIGDFLDYNLPIRITGISSSGKSATGELMVPKPIPAPAGQADHNI